MWLLVVIAIVTGACAGEEAVLPPQVVVFGPWVGEQAGPFTEALAVFEAETGITVR